MPLLRGGSWSVAGIKLPEFGVTEKAAKIVSGNRTTDLSNALRGANAQVPTTPTYNYSNAQSQPQLNPEVLGAKDPSQQQRQSGTGAQAPVSAPVTNTNFINDQLNVGNDQIDLDYNSYVDSLNAQEGAYRGEAANAESAIQTQAGRARTQLAQDKASKEQGLTNYETDANKSYSTATQTARDMYRQVQQQNIAQLSAQGLSSSSVAEALAEKLGVETARRITSAAGSLADVVTNINKERKNLGEFYQTKVTELEQEVTNNIAGIRSQLMTGIDALNRARNVAASERANRRQALLVDAQSAIAQIQQQAQAYQQSLAQWKAENDARFANTAKDLPGVMDNYRRQLAEQTQQYGSEFTLAPQFNADQYGNIIPTGVSVSKKKTENDPNSLDNPFL